MESSKFKTVNTQRWCIGGATYSKEKRNCLKFKQLRSLGGDSYSGRNYLYNLLYLNNEGG